jgi:hypothetical protein
MLKKYVSLYFSMSTGDETFDLPNSLVTNNYLCGVLSLSGKIPINSQTSKPSRLFLCSDFCQDSFVNNTKLPVLCEIKFKSKGTVSTNLFNISWLHILRPTIASVRLYICDEEGTPYSLAGGNLNCSLLFVHSP